MRVFGNRREAGRLLAEKLTFLENEPEAIVLALPRGGVPIAFEVAWALNLPLDIFLVRKVGAPDQPELAIGAIASGGVTFLNNDLLRRLGISSESLEPLVRVQRKELARREKLYRKSRPLPSLRGRTVVLVDDGLATGASMLAAIAAVRMLVPRKIIVAVPVLAPSAISTIKVEVEGLVYVMAPISFGSVGRFYANFDQTTDEEVCELLHEARSFLNPADPIQARQKSRQRDKTSP